MKSIISCLSVFFMIIVVGSSSLHGSNDSDWSEFRESAISTGKFAAPYLIKGGLMVGSFYLARNQIRNILGMTKVQRDLKIIDGRLVAVLQKQKGMHKDLKSALRNQEFMKNALSYNQELLELCDTRLGEANKKLDTLTPLTGKISSIDCRLGSLQGELGEINNDTSKILRLLENEEGTSDPAAEVFFKRSLSPFGSWLKK